jgi:hypothetical protein
MASNNYGPTHIAAALIRCSQQITPQIGWSVPLNDQVKYLPHCPGVKGRKRLNTPFYNPKREFHSFAPMKFIP